MASISTVIKRTLNSFRPVRGPGNKSPMRQIWEVIMLILRVQLEPEEYFRYKFYKQDQHLERVLNYVNGAQFHRDMDPVLNPPEWHYILNNKLFFNLYYRTYGIPVTHLYGFLQKNLGFLGEGKCISYYRDLRDFLLCERPKSMVLKPHNLFGGYGIKVFNSIDYNGEITFTTKTGTSINYSELSANLGDALRTGKHITGYIVEEMVDQHERLDDIYPYAANTLRLITYLTREGQPKFLNGILRMGTHGNLVDNVCAGGIYSIIQMDSGMLNEGISRNLGEDIHVARHPDTGVKLEGFQLPHWQQITDLCLKAQLVTPHQRFIGWDIAVCKNGPVFLEGNSCGVDVANLQIDTDGFITGEFRKDMSAYGIDLPDRIPGISLRKLYQSYKISRNMDKHV